MVTLAELPPSTTVVTPLTMVTKLPAVARRASMTATPLSMRGTMISTQCLPPLHSTEILPRSSGVAVPCRQRRSGVPTAPAASSTGMSRHRRRTGRPQRGRGPPEWRERLLSPSVDPSQPRLTLAHSLRSRRLRLAGMGAGQGTPGVTHGGHVVGNESLRGQAGLWQAEDDHRRGPFPALHGDAMGCQGRHQRLHGAHRPQAGMAGRWFSLPGRSVPSRERQPG